MLRTRTGGQEHPRFNGSEKLRQGAEFTGADRVSKSGAGKARTGESELGESPGAQAELWWGLLAAVVRWGGEGMAAGCSARVWCGGCGVAR